MDSINLQGIRAAQDFARTGRFIFAIKHILMANPGISRETAKSVIASFRYGDKPERWEDVRRSIRVL